VVVLWINVPVEFSLLYTTRSSLDLAFKQYVLNRVGNCHVRSPCAVSLSSVKTSQARAALHQAASSDDEPSRAPWSAQHQQRSGK